MQRGLNHTGVKRAGGFSLLEIVFVLAMVAMLITWFTLSVSTVETEQKLKEASAGIESLAKRGRNIAVKQQRAYQLTISEGGIVMAPQYQQHSGHNGFTEEEQNEDVAAAQRFDDITATEATDPEVAYEIKRWRSDDWELIKADKKVVLTLDPIGLVEPISIRCSIGKSWLIHELHPLTAGIRDEEMNIEKQ